MSVFDAISHSFSTVAIGGFSTHDASIGYFDSSVIEGVATLFMLISGVNFALHFAVVRNFAFWKYIRDEEFRTYLILLGFLTLVTSSYLYLTDTSDAKDSFVNGIFHAVSIGTTGGMKVIRVLLLYKQGQRELSRLLHPNSVIMVKVGRQAMSNRMIDVVWGFFATYVALLAIMMLMLMAAGLDQETAFSAVVACLNNLGPGLGQVAANYSSVGDFEYSVLSMAMLFGRLEIFTLLILFTPAFWRR